jgi:putative ABC transport system permease protein
VRVRPDHEGPLPGAVAAAFPNVTAVPVRDVMERVAAIMDQVAVAARAVALVAVVAAAVVLAGALRVTREQRLYESVVLKAVGATRGTLARAFAVEYALLGAAAGVVGSAVAVALAWGIQRWVIEVPWSWQWPVLVAGLAGAAVLAVAVGALTTYRLLGHRPLAVLRGE